MALLNILKTPKNLSEGGAVGTKTAVMVDRLSFEFIYQNLSANVTVTPYISIDGVNFAEYPAGKIVLSTADTIESVTLLGLSPNMFVKWEVKAADKPAAGTVTTLNVIR